MNSSRSPITMEPMWNPIQLALLREAGIAGSSLSAGLAGLRRANYAEPGTYSHAFFSFSIGLERMLKLIYILDHLIEHQDFPSDSDLRTIGHDVARLFEHSDEVKTRRGLSSGPTPIGPDSIEIQIVRFMSRFAKGTRYYNLDFLTRGKASKNAVDPIKDWIETVGEMVLEKHFTKRREAQVRHNAQTIDIVAGKFMYVAHTAEDGTPLNDAFSASYHTGKTEVIRKYATLYAARLCRYLYYILWELRHKCHDRGIEIPFLDELFFPFMNDDAYLLSRKTFPPRGQ